MLNQEVSPSLSGSDPSPEMADAPESPRLSVSSVPAPEADDDFVDLEAQIRVPLPKDRTMPSSWLAPVKQRMNCVLLLCGTVIIVALTVFAFNQLQIGDSAPVVPTYQRAADPLTLSEKEEVKAKKEQDEVDAAKARIMSTSKMWWLVKYTGALTLALTASSCIIPCLPSVVAPITNMIPGCGPVGWVWGTATGMVMAVGGGMKQQALMSMAGGGMNTIKNQGLNALEAATDFAEYSVKGEFKWWNPFSKGHVLHFLVVKATTPKAKTAKTSGKASKTSGKAGTQKPVKN